MNDQDSDSSQEFCNQENSEIEATALSLLAMLHLNGGNHQPTTTTTTVTPLFSTTSMDRQCTKRSSTKRQSPASLSLLQEPSSKRATILPPSSAIFSSDHRILGFTKLSLPPTFSNIASSSPALHRTISDPINSPGANNLSDQAPPNSEGSFLNHQLLYRSISDPTSASFQVVTTTTPPLPPPAARKVISSPSIGESGQNLKEESPNTKRLKRMKDRLREIRQWWNDAIKEDEEDIVSEDEHSIPKDESEVNQVVTESEGGPSEEAVWVERNGECLILHFKCPCGKGYQILLIGKNCYYKLTAF